MPTAAHCIGGGGGGSGGARSTAAAPRPAAPDFNEATRPPWGEVGRVGTLGVIAAVSKLYLRVLNSTSITGEEEFHRVVLGRPPGQGLITVSNHTSTTDDPAVIAAMLPWSAFSAHRHLRSVRWSLCAREICFKNTLLRHFFLNGQTLPIERGQGTGQPIMKTAASLVAGGAWVHVFPEGHVGYSGRLEPCRWGIGRLVCDAAVQAGRDPAVVPFYHSGMGVIQPRGSTVPQAGHALHVNIGPPMDLSDLTCRCGAPGEDQQQVWMDITARVRAALAALERESPPNTAQLRPGEAAWREPTLRGKRDLKEADPVLPPDGVVGS